MNNKNSQKLKLYKDFKRVLAPIILLLLSNACLSAMYPEYPIEQDINESILIFKGKLVDEYYQKREGTYTKRSRDGSLFKGKRDKLFTIYVFSINEILKGNYKQDTIEVMMLGGCENGYCAVSTAGYSYDLGDEALLFLRGREGYPSTYLSLLGASTVFDIDSSGRLLKQSLGEPRYNENKQLIKINENGEFIIDKDPLTLDSLRLKIKQEAKK